MAKCGVINLATNELVNYINAEVTDLPPEGHKLIEIPSDSYWNTFGKQVMLKTQYWDGTQILDIPPIPDGYYFDGMQLQLESNG